MKNMKKIISILLAVLMVMSLCACGKSASSSAYTPGSAYYSSAPAYTEEAYYEYAAEEDYGFSATTASGSHSSNAANDAPDEKPDKIIYSSDVNLETTEFEKTIENLQQLIDSYGGWVQSGSVNGASYSSVINGTVRGRSADYTIRIPAKHFDTVMSSLSNLGNIPYSRIYTENVTSQYYDVNARLTAYKAQEARLIEMLDIAETVEDIITIEDKLTDVRYMIESLQSTLNNWDRQVSYSTIYLSVTEVTIYTPQPQASFGQKLASSLMSGIRGVGRFFSDLALGLAEALPSLVLLAAVVFIIVKVVKKAVKKHRAKHPASEGDYDINK